MLDINPQGKANSGLFAEPGRELTLEDIAIQGEKLSDGVAELKKLRQTHHRIAKLLATGMKQVEVAAATGYCQGRISILQTNPLFQELCEHYRKVEDERFADVRNLMEDLTVDTLSAISEKLERDSDKIPLGTLKSVAEMLLDRTGRAPIKKSESVHALLTGDDLNAIKQSIADSGVRSRNSARDERMDATESSEQSHIRPGMGDADFSRPVRESTPSEGITIEGEVLRKESGEGS